MVFGLFGGNKDKNAKGSTNSKSSDVPVTGDHDSPEFAVHMLNELCERRTAVLIKFPKHEEQFVSIIIHVDEKNNQITLDELTPTEGNDYIKENTEFRCSSSDHGIGIHFKSHYIESGTDNNIPYHKVQLPEKVEYLQRREAFRAKVIWDDYSQLRVPVEKKGTALTSCHIIDISFSGICLMLAKQNLETVFEKGDIVKDLSFTTCDGDKFKLDIEIRRINYERDNERSIFAGRFKDVDRDTQRQINKFVSHMQREQRRREAKD